MAAQVLASEFAINGAFGELRDQDGDVICEVQEITATINIGRRDIQRAGSRSTGYKAMTASAEGSLRVMHVREKWTSAVIEIFKSGAERQLQRQFHLKVTIDDPEALGVEEYRLLRVRLWSATLGFQVNEILERTFPFTFEDIVELQRIEGDPSISQHASRYIPRSI